MLESMQKRSSPVNAHKVATKYFDDFKRERRIPAVEPKDSRITAVGTGESNAVSTAVGSAVVPLEGSLEDGILLSFLKSSKYFVAILCAFTGLERFCIDSSMLDRRSLFAGFFFLGVPDDVSSAFVFFIFIDLNDVFGQSPIICSPRADRVIFKDMLTISTCLFKLHIAMYRGEGIGIKLLVYSV